eukprot:474313-Rhodomonas_salina.1
MIRGPDTVCRGFLSPLSLPQGDEDSGRAGRGRLERRRKRGVTRGESEERGGRWGRSGGGERGAVGVDCADGEPASVAAGHPSHLCARVPHHVSQ